MEIRLNGETRSVEDGLSVADLVATVNNASATVADRTAALDALSLPAALLLARCNGVVAWYVAFCAHLVGSLPGAQVRSTRGLAAVLALALLAARLSGRTVAQARVAARRILGGAWRTS